MGISPEKVNSCAGTGVIARAGRTACFKILHRTKFCRLVAMLFALAASAHFVSAQEERPQIMPGERKAAQKKDTGPRAIGVLRQGSDGKSTLIPVAILINGKFWDADSYKADPIPMALEPGTVYEAEQAGNSLGLFTIGSALHSRAANASVPWIATGAWHAAGSGPVVKEFKAESTPVGIGSADDAPRLTRNPAAASGSAGTTGANAPAGPTSGTPASTTSPGNSNAPPASTPSGSSDPDAPPRLKKPASPSPDSNPPGQTQPASGQSSPGNNPPDSTKGDSKPASKTAEDRASIPASDSGAAEANRPRLRRGKPAESFADEDIPGYSRPGASTATVASVDKPIASAKDDAKFIPAISDASGPEPHSFTFEFLQDEQGDRLKQMTGLAKDKLHAYMDARIKATTTAASSAPAHAGPNHRAAAVKAAEPVFENVRLVPYDLWSSNQEILVFSAEAHLPPPAADAAPDPAAAIQYSILLVAYPDTYNNLRTLYAGITDKYHLDVTPRLELIDAVDADGDGRGELLFRETSDAGVGWAIYRANADKLWKLFDSLNPE
jgi:hypothetical protein